MAVFVALLRGINVGGNNKIAMQTLKQLCEDLGYLQVSTYINTGNIIFSADESDVHVLAQQISNGIMKETGLQIATLVLSGTDLDRMCASLPPLRQQDKIMKTDVMFLRPEIDHPTIVDELPVQEHIETLLYAPGMLVRHIAYEHYTKSKLPKALMRSVYKHMTIRNVNTVRKLAALVSREE